MQYKGIISAMLTPMDEQQNINHDATRQLIDHLIGHGADGLFILGTNGECHVLTDEEKLAFAETVIRHTAGRVPVFAGTGGNATREVIKLSKQMEQIGADALSVITPYFIPPSQDELAAHYEAVAASVSLPIMLYNMPGKTGINIEPETVKRLAEIDNIIGVKDSSGSLDNMKAYLAATAGIDFGVFSGSDSLILDILLAGGQGAVAATSNFLTAIDVSIYQNFLKGDLEAARAAQKKIEELRRVLKYGTIPSVIKKVVNLNGIPVGPARLPATEPQGAELEDIIQVVKAYQAEMKEGEYYV